MTQLIGLSALSTPFGQIHILEGDRGLLSVLLPRAKRPQSPEPIAHRLQGKLRRHSRSVAKEELAAYLAGELTAFQLPLDWSLSQGFNRRVLRILARLPYGTLTTYGKLAALAKAPGAARAVGGSMGRNPLPIVVPCHRVIASGDRLGGFGGGLALKRWLLEHEGISVVQDRVTIQSKPS